MSDDRPTLPSADDPDFAAGAERLLNVLDEHQARKARNRYALTLGLAQAVVVAMTSRGAQPPKLHGDTWSLELLGDRQRSDLDIIAETLLETGTVALAAPLLTLAGEWANRELLPEDELTRLYDLIPVPDVDYDDTDDEFPGHP